MTHQFVLKMSKTRKYRLTWVNPSTWSYEASRERHIIQSNKGKLGIFKVSRIRSLFPGIFFFFIISYAKKKKRKKRSDNKNDYATFFTKKQTIPARSGSFFQRLVKLSVCLSPAAGPGAAVFRIFEMICLKCSLTKLRCTKSLHRSLQRQLALMGSLRFPAAYKRWNCSS